MVPGAKWLGQVAPAIEPVLTSNSFLAHLTAAVSGLGFAVAPEQFVAVTPGLVQVPVHPSLLAKHPLPVETLWLVGHRALRDVPRVAVVWAFLVEQFAPAALAGSRELAGKSQRANGQGRGSVAPLR